MDYSTNLDAFGSIFQIVLVDLLLSGDNALVIALACRSLGEAQARRAMRIGIGAAILVRLFLTFIISSVLATPGLQGALLMRADLRRADLNGADLRNAPRWRRSARRQA